MGARAHMSPRLMQILPRELKFGYIGRPERASTAEGYPAAHARSRAASSRPRWTSSRPVGMYPREAAGRAVAPDASSEAIRRPRSARRRRASCAAYGDVSPRGAPRVARRGALAARCDGLASVPWHRIVRADGSLAKGARQRALLEAEGVPFRGERVDMRAARLPD